MSKPVSLRVSRLVQFFAAERVREAWVAALNAAQRHADEAQAAEHQAHAFMARQNWDVADSYWRKAANSSLRAAAEHLSYGGDNWAASYENAAERCLRMVGKRPRVQA